MKSRRKQMYRRHIVVSSVASGLLAGAPSAMADCVDADGWQCEYRSGETYTSVQGVSKAGYSPPHSEGTTDGGAGPNITINDTGAAFTVSTGFDTYRGVIYGQSFGGAGEDAGKGGAAGAINISSDGTITATVNGSVNSSGDVQVATPRAFVTGLSQGGDGEMEDNDDNDSDGGAGAAGNDVRVQIGAHASYRIDGAIATNFEGVLAQSGGGSGGRQNSALFSNQRGGRGGDGKLARIDHGGSIEIGAQAPIQSSTDLVSGLRAWSFGGRGGHYNGDAGWGGAVEVEHRKGATIQVRVHTNTPRQQIYGILAESEGASGYHSEDNDDRGGQGGGSGPVTVNVNSGISVDVTGDTLDRGAAIRAASHGGKGGTGPNGNTGGDGGDAGSVAVTLARADAPYDITTSGDLIIGVLAVSRGGEGGDGADNTAVAGRSGGGGFGGDGGDVSVTAQSDIRIATHGNYASGMMAMSLGGGGGTGGDFVNILGGGAGNGGNGGDAGNVTVNNGADITTTGLYSFGIAAQSISGGGGSGGIAAGLVLEVGGDGQAGGTPGDVEVSNFGAISTDGYGSHGILAHSVADGGGAAGGSGGIFAIGGNASSAHESTGGSVSLANAGTVATRGDAAKGILAQSIGGGGGSGAGTAGVLSVGGQGQAGGDGGQVIVSSLGTVNTWGEFAHGVQAHSIGGGGGDGGSAFDLALGAGIGVGGVGAGGGDGGAVTVSGSETANIHTWGYGSIGLLAQSVGKGGGSGGTAFGAGVADLTFQIGGDGGGAGSGGAVQVDRSNMQIATAGGLAAGLQAQSIGGGGGTGGGVITDVAGAEIALNMSVGGSGGVAGDGGQVDVKLGRTQITTTGSVDQSAESEDADGSSAILAQSIGGGGGNGGNSIIDSFILGIPIEGVGVSVPINLAIGGTGGAGGDGAGVSVDLDQSELRTFGQYSRGIHAQSVGGGGGNGGDSSVYSLAVDFPTTFNLQLQAAVGGQCDATACAGGDGGAVDVDLKQSLISTGGDYATGVLAQSLGGGGGSGGAAYSSHYALGTEASVALTVSVGGKGAVGGNGGAVDVGQDADSYIVTSGSGARGIVAQSVGGGGGESQGVAAAATLGGTLIPGVDPLPRLDMVVQVGREGAGGGDGAAAGVRNAGVISTQGRNSDGILAQSIGGGGGLGGSVGASYDSVLNNVSALIKHIITNGRRIRLNTSGRLALGIGGVGGVGGTGGQVSVLNEGKIITVGDYADGIVAQSIGGGGGEGGVSVVDSLTSLYSGTLSIGGSGGAGGLGGQVDVNLRDGSSITTQGGTAYGVLAQSVGGGGGLGAIGSALFSGTINVGSAAGGSGGDASHGGAVNFASSDDTIVQTLGDGSHGVVLQSVGNGGGAGGTSDYGANSYILDYSLVLALGGEGGNGGNGGTVTACGYQAGCSMVNIVTAGDQAAGLVAQSVGGGGGVGGVNTISNPKRFWGAIKPVNVTAGLELGGKGGAGGDGGTVVVEGEFGIATYGDFSPGVLAQSIGGGGGLGGIKALYPWDKDLPNGEHTTTQFTVHLGGSDGQGGDGGVVSLQNAGDVTTRGSLSHGMVAQSIGGGGGVAGAVVKPVALDDTSDPSGALTTESAQFLHVGGAPGEDAVMGAGNSNPLKEQDAVSVAMLGSIATGGDWAMGLLAQAIGGGGGSGYVGALTDGQSTPAEGGVSVGGGAGSYGYGGDIAVRVDGGAETGIATSGIGAYGILAQSIGAGGGLGVALASGTGVALNVGGRQSADTSHVQDGGKVRLYGSKTILTDGADAHGVVLQSVGGGGGVGGITLPASGGSVAGDIVLGGTDYGNGQTVTVDSALLRIGTAGDRAFGLVAQSIGGGGGIASAGAAGSLSGIRVGGQGDAIAHGGDVSVTLAEGSLIQTTGRGAHGMVAQSIGGGGGIAGDLGGAPLVVGAAGADGGAAGGGGNGGVLTVVASADIVTAGDNAFGILAQSIGGGGGLSGDASAVSAGPTQSGRTGSGGLIHLAQSGRVYANGNGSVGIFAQSQGPTADGGMDLTIMGDVVGGTGDQGAGVWLVGGNQNWLAVQPGASVTAGSGVAIRYDGTRSVYAGSETTVQNYGTIAGDILLHAPDSSSAGTINNLGAMTPAAAARTGTPARGGVLVGARRYDASVVNHGTLIVGHNAMVDGTAISGDFEQGRQGTLMVDADFERRAADRLHVQGDAQLDGQLDIAALSLMPGRRVTVLTVDGDAAGQLAPRQSPIFDYALHRNGNDYHLSVDGADFAAPSLGLGRRQAALAGHLQEIWDVGAPGKFSRLFAMVDNVSAQGQGGYRELLSGLTPEVLLAPAVQMQAGMARFGDSLMSCPTFTGNDAMVGERECAWGQVSHRDSRQDGSGDAAGYTSDTTTYQVGAQKRVAPHWFVGMSAAYQNASLRSDGGRVASKGDSGLLGIAVKREIGPWLLAAGLSGSYGRYDTERQVGLPGMGGSAKSDPDVYGGALRLRVARTFAYPSFYFKPYMDVDAVYARMPGYREKGSDLALEVEGSDQFTFAFSPTLEVGGKVELNGATLRPYAFAGATFLTDDQWTTRARFAQAPDGSRGFQASLPIDDSVARLGAGLQISTPHGVEVRLQYEGEFSGRTSSNSASLKVGIPF